MEVKQPFIGSNGAIWCKPPSDYEIVIVEGEIVLRVKIPKDLPENLKIFVCELDGNYNEQKKWWSGVWVPSVKDEDIWYYKLKIDKVHLITVPSSDGKVYSNFVRISKDRKVEFIDRAKLPEIFKPESGLEALRKHFTGKEKEVEKVVEPDVLSDTELDDLMKF